MVPQKQQPTSKKQEAKRSKEGNNETIDKPCVEAAEKTSTEKNQTMNQAKTRNAKNKTGIQKWRTQESRGQTSKKSKKKAEKRRKKGKMEKRTNQMGDHLSYGRMLCFRLRGKEACISNQLRGILERIGEDTLLYFHKQKLTTLQIRARNLLIYWYLCSITAGFDVYCVACS